MSAPIETRCPEPDNTIRASAFRTLELATELGDIVRNCVDGVHVRKHLESIAIWALRVAKEGMRVARHCGGLEPPSRENVHVKSLMSPLPDEIVEKCDHVSLLLSDILSRLGAPADEKVNAVNAPAKRSYVEHPSYLGTEISMQCDAGAENLKFLAELHTGNPGLAGVLRELSRVLCLLGSGKPIERRRVATALYSMSLFMPPAMFSTKPTFPDPATDGDDDIPF